MVEPEKKLNYARDDVFIISANKSADKIEELESNIYLNPVLIFAYFGRVNALYSKTHKYVKGDREIKERLIKIRTALYDDNFLEDLNHDPDKIKTKQQFLKLLDALTKIYREMTDDFSMGIFPSIEIVDKNPGIIKRKH